MYRILLFFITIAGLLFSQPAAFAQECYDAVVMSPTPFLGNEDEVIRLDDGSVWQVKFNYEYLYVNFPRVSICPDQEELVIGAKKLHIKRLPQSEANNDPYSEGAISEIIETRVEDIFDGWLGNTVLKLANGEYWEQIEYYYHPFYAYRPRVFIYRSGKGYKMKVEGINKAVGVMRLA